MKNHFGKWISVILFLMLLHSCSSSGQNTSQSSNNASGRTFRIPETPKTMLTPTQKEDFLVDHYWDRFDFSDTVSIQKPQVAERPFVDFIRFLSKLPDQKAARGMHEMMHRAVANADVLRYFQSLGEKYLYEPISPDRNETLYLSMLETFLASNRIDDAWKIRPQKQYELAQKNRVGSKAIDFGFTQFDGTETTLYGIKSDFLLLFFHNPGCTDCKMVRESILASGVIRKLQDSGAMKVLTIYPGDDQAEWKKYYSDLPARWINGYDSQSGIMSGDLYDLKAIPSLYLLNEQKIVLLKDARLEEIEAYLSTIKK